MRGQRTKDTSLVRDRRTNPTILTGPGGGREFYGGGLVTHILSRENIVSPTQDIRTLVGNTILQQTTERRVVRRFPFVLKTKQQGELYHCCHFIERYYKGWEEQE